VQTLKTSAIVVLLVTVMYAAYVSLTTPPQQAGPAVDELILATDELDIDVGMPDSLDAMGISTGELASDFGGPQGFGGGNSPSELAEFDSAGEAVSGSISDSSSSLAGGEGGGIELDLSDQTAASESADSATVIGLPTPQGTAPNFNLDPDQEFASTGSDFSLPSAQAAAAAFDGGDQSWSNPSPDDQAAAGSTSGSDRPPQTPENIRDNPLFSRDEPAAASGDEIAVAQANLGLANAVRLADKQYGEDQKKQALQTLSLFYDNPKLDDQNRETLLSRLDPLAREVIYSQEHLLEQPHRVRQNETLMQIATQYEVPWQLLANINNIDDPITVLPGTDLKVLRGPFRASVDITHGELTLFLGDLYAGRFPIAVGSDPTPRAGTFTILDKQSARTYYDRNGSPVPPGSANNPYGSMWMDLGGQLCIHGSPDNTSASKKGCISVAGRYAGDLYGILSQGSSVTIRR